MKYSDQVSGLKGQGQPCSEPLKFLHFFLVFGQKWAWAQVSVHLNRKIFPSFFVFVMKKQEKELFFWQEKNKKHVKIRWFLFFVFSVYKQQEMELVKSTRKSKLRLFNFLNVSGNQIPIQNSCLNIVLQIKPGHWRHLIVDFLTTS